MFAFDSSDSDANVVGRLLEVFVILLSLRYSPASVRDENEGGDTAV